MIYYENHWNKPYIRILSTKFVKSDCFGYSISCIICFKIDESLIFATILPDVANHTSTPYHFIHISRSPASSSWHDDDPSAMRKGKHEIHSTSNALHTEYRIIESPNNFAKIWFTCLLTQQILWFWDFACITLNFAQCVWYSSKFNENKVHIHSIHIFFKNDFAILQLDGKTIIFCLLFLLSVCLAV